MNSGIVLNLETSNRKNRVIGDEVSKRLQAMELNLLSTGSFADLCKALNFEYRKLLSVDAVSLLVFERETREFTLADIEGVCATESPIFIVCQDRVGHYTGQCKSGVWVGDYRDDLHARFFPKCDDKLNAIAILPLSRRAKVIGILALASAEGWSAPRLMDQEQLNRLAAIVGVCVENLYNQEHIRQVGLHDPLTRVFNRRYFSDHICQVLSRSLRGGWPVCCIYLDIDYFKSVNDRHGHAAGDAVLCGLSERIGKQLRSGEVFARMGGEEFCILLTETSASLGVLVAERIRAVVQSSPFKLPGGGGVDVTISCGVADSALLNTANTADDLVDRADHALYQAKQRGRNKVVADL